MCGICHVPTPGLQGLVLRIWLYQTGAFCSTAHQPRDFARLEVGLRRWQLAAPGCAAQQRGGDVGGLQGPQHPSACGVGGGWGKGSGGRGEGGRRGLRGLGEGGVGAPPALSIVSSKGGLEELHRALSKLAPLYKELKVKQAMRSNAGPKQVEGWKNGFPNFRGSQTQEEYSRGILPSGIMIAPIPPKGRLFLQRLQNRPK